MYKVEKEALANHNNFMRHVIVCVARDALKSGVAKQLNQACHQAAREKGLELMTATCSYLLPEILALKSGYKLVAKFDYEKFVSKNQETFDENILQVYRRLATKHGHYSVLTKKV